MRRNAKLVMDRGGVRGERPRQFAHREIMFKVFAFVLARAHLIGQFVFVEGEKHRCASVLAMQRYASRSFNRAGTGVDRQRDIRAGLFAIDGGNARRPRLSAMMRHSTV